MSGLQENQKLMSALNVIVHTGIEKRCSKCKTVKLVEEFSFSKKSKDGRNCACKKCHNEGCRIYKENNLGKVVASAKKWRENNRSITAKINKRYRQENPEKSKASSKKWRDNNKELKHQIDKSYRERNTEKIREKSKIDMRKRLKNPKHKLSHNMSDLVRYSLRGKKCGKSWEGLVGYTAEQLKIYLEKQFTEGMSWKNHSINGWHIDHIIPIAAFNYTLPTDIDFKKCWTLKNLRPLWSLENRKKQDRLDKPFQPSLALTVTTEEI
jgi:hypothetical protein